MWYLVTFGVECPKSGFFSFFFLIDIMDSVDRWSLETVVVDRLGVPNWCEKNDTVVVR